ncbi:MAG TPA: hypothetical protein DF613_08425 [Lachnospiraceae bacterium]|nr:hypothetical protein [Lachnospiraceae bacterium]
MKKIIKNSIYMLAAVLLVGGIQVPVKAQENSVQEGTNLLAEEAGVTVYTRDEFMDALRQKKSPITVATVISVGDEAETGGQMRPVLIPSGTVIRGTSKGCIDFRCPLQLEGDGVIFRDIGMHFVSTDALWSVPHREIFLAGHSLTLDNVNTYVEGGGTGLGGIGGFEKELLPTVYGGGYPGTAVGGNASLTVVNSNEKTLFQGIYMGHDSGSDNKVLYQGAALVKLDAKAVVRDAVDTSQNSQAEIYISGTGDSAAKATKFYGNENTAMTLAGVFMESTEVDAVEVVNIGNVVLKNKAWLAPVTDTMRNVTLQEGACLDLSNVKNAEITGDFGGENDPAGDGGILVLNPEGSLRIGGTITGTTRFQTGHRLFPGVLLKKPYIYAAERGGDGSAFVLAEEYMERGFELRYANGIWDVYGEQPVLNREIGRIEITSAPKKVDLTSIAQNEEEIQAGTIPDESVFFEITWYDKDGIPFSNSDIIEDYYFYDNSYVILIRSDYWKSDAVVDQNQTIWSQPVILLESNNYPGRYCLAAQPGYFEGDYTVLFCSRYIDEKLETVADVKALRNIVLAERDVNFYISSSEKPEGHVHEYQKVLDPQPTCTDVGIMTYTCSCGDAYTEKIAARGHQPVTDPMVAPTETAEGKTEGSHCSVCGQVLKAQEIIPATGNPVDPENPETPETPQEPQPHKHTYQSSVTRKPTCTQEGTRTFTCSCGNTYTEKIAPEDHQYVKECTPATPERSGKQQQVCRVCAQTNAMTVIDSPRELILNKTVYSYDGKVKRPAVTVKDSKGKVLTAGTDYRVSYPKGRKNPGVYTVTVELQGNYSGRMTGSFTVKPRKTSLKKVTAKSRGMQVTWKKQAAQIDGYQIQYSTDKKFTGKTAKFLKAKKSAAAKTVSRLKEKKQYYVRIRTYKAMKVNGKKKTLYSDWSDVKTVRTKK